MPELPLISNTESQDCGPRVSLSCPVTLPNASGFLWNSKMALQVNCRGYASAHHMQPEPAKYSYAPNIEAKTFLQPEHPYFTHHPGRFFYIKDEDSGEVFSAPHEPMRIRGDKFSFSQGTSDIEWCIEHLQLEITIALSLGKDDALERWSLSVKNLSSSARKLSIYPYFSIGYMSWMNQSASFEYSLNAIVASCVTPYQKVEDYFKQNQFKDKTFLVANKTPHSWCANQSLFEGEGGLHNPDGINQTKLNNDQARYETPVAVMQYKTTLDVSEQVEYQLLFGAAKSNSEIKLLKERYLGRGNSVRADREYSSYMAQGKGCITIETNDTEFDQFINHWLPRQMFYHGDVNRLSTDPQTRNYVQDNMGMSYIKPEVTRQAFIDAVAQQNSNGSMPDGILLHPEAELKYINQIPHADHCVWLPICLEAYLNETADLELFEQVIGFADSKQQSTFSEHIELALDWLLDATDHRGLSLIEQGDWCDPMNMVGYKGKGVSSWLSLATAYALNSWCDLCEAYDINVSANKVSEFRYAAKAMNAAVNKYLWDGNWFARGITDDDVIFGSKKDEEGKIFLNPQSWAMLSGAADPKQVNCMLASVKDYLDTPYGVMMLAPSFTQMREDIGRVTQKHPGVAENGSVYNHAAIFYSFSLYRQGQADLAFDILKKILPSSSNVTKSGQLPAYIPNYYRGAYYQFPEHAGRSSQLFNTGTVSWLYRCIVEELCGLKGSRHGLMVEPKLPSTIEEIKGKRYFRGATFQFSIFCSQTITKRQISVDGELIYGSCIENICEGRLYQLVVEVPRK